MSSNGSWPLAACVGCLGCNAILWPFVVYNSYPVCIFLIRELLFLLVGSYCYITHTFHTSLPRDRVYPHIYPGLFTVAGAQFRIRACPFSLYVCIHTRTCTNVYNIASRKSTVVSINVIYRSLSIGKCVTQVYI